MSQYGQPPPGQYGQAPPYGQPHQQGGAPPPYQQQPYQQAGARPPQHYQQQHAPPQSGYGAPPASSAPYQNAPSYGGQGPYGGSAPPAQQQAHAGNYQQGSQPGGYGAAPPPAASGGLCQTVASAWFESIDTDRTGTIDVKELQRALAMGNLHYGLSDVEKMIQAFDTNGSRSLHMPEFVKLHDFLNNVTNSFNHFDSPPRKAINVDQLTQALRQAGFTMDAPVIQAMFKRHDPDNSKSLSLDEYIRICLFLQSCVRTFSAFDTQKSGRVTMDINQFVYAASHV